MGVHLGIATMKSQTETIGQAILCIENEPELVQSLRHVLRHLPYRLICANNRTQALEILQDIRPVLILANTINTVASNIRLLDALRKHGLDRVPIIKISDNDPYELDGSYSIHRPFNNQQILNVIEKVLRETTNDRPA